MSRNVLDMTQWIAPVPSRHHAETGRPRAERLRKHAARRQHDAAADDDARLTEAHGIDAGDILSPTGTGRRVGGLSARRVAADLLGPADARVPLIDRPGHQSRHQRERQRGVHPRVRHASRQRDAGGRCARLYRERREPRVVDRRHESGRRRSSARARPAARRHVPSAVRSSSSRPRRTATSDTSGADWGSTVQPFRFQSATERSPARC